MKETEKSFPQSHFVDIEQMQQLGDLMPDLRRMMETRSSTTPSETTPQANDSSTISSDPNHL